jgi:hypothetical protein
MSLLVESSAKARKPVTHDYYGYIMTNDSGFAPCVADGFLSLACCMPTIRKRCPKGSWVAGWGGVQYGRGRLIYLMQVEETPDFDSYFADERFTGRIDNIYRTVGGKLKQISAARFHTSPKEQEHDTSVPRVLVSKRFVYFGKRKLTTAKRFAGLVPQYRGGRVADGEEVMRLVNWASSDGWGVKGEPHRLVSPNPTVLVQIRLV